MSIVSGIVVFLLTWWVVLFAVLPWGVRQPENPAPGFATGAPENPHLKQKFLITTFISVVIWLIIYALVAAEIIDFNLVARQMMEEDTFK